MLYPLSIAIFLLAAMLSSYYAPQFAEAQTSDRERCDDDICHVKITSNGFSPKTLLIRIGTTVVWTNTDDGRHTVTSGSPDEVTAPLKSLLLEKDETYEFIFQHGGLFEGSYKYFDQVTRTMRGEIIVEPAPEEIEEPPMDETIEIDFENPGSGVKEFSLSNGSVESMAVDPVFHSLIITVETELPNGKLEITLDRALIDSKTNGDDDHFVVFVDGDEGFYEEIASTPKERTLEIVVPNGTTEIEIVGTQVIPEFPVAMLIIAAVFTSMIAAFRLRTRFW
ncbi:MAG: cupredoxin domain-containing protein [Nitrososphaerales archaeon]